MSNLLEAHEKIGFIHAFAPRRNRSVRKRVRQLRHAAICADLDTIRAEVAGKKWVGAF